MRLDELRASRERLVRARELDHARPAILRLLREPAMDHAREIRRDEIRIEVARTAPVAIETSSAP